ncbi:unnamed protein product [Closterium sp. NIES-54]
MPVFWSGPTDSSARSCLKRPCAVRPSSHSVALPCSYSHCLPPARRALLPCPARTALPLGPRPAALQPVHRAALPLGPRAALPCSLRAAPPCPAAERVTPCCPAQRVPHCPARRTLLQPARRTLLPYASRPTAAHSSRSAAPRVAPCCSPCVAPCCSPSVALCCSARRALLQPPRRALLPCASRPAAARASRPAALHSTRPAAHAAQAEPRRPARAALLLLLLLLLLLVLLLLLLEVLLEVLEVPPPSPTEPPCCYYCCCCCCSCCCCSCYCCCCWRCCWKCWRCRRPAPPSRPAATTAAAAAAARATAAAGGGAAGSTGGAAGAGGTGGAAGSTGGAAGAGDAGPTTDHHCLSWPLSQQLQQPGVDSSNHCLSHTTPPLSSFRCVPASVEAAALSSSESAAAPGAGESAAALGARESADALGASASPASGEALHTFTLDSGASSCFFRDCTTFTPLAAPVPVSLADPTRGPVVARASTVLPYPAVPSGSLSGPHLPAFSTNLLSNAVLQDEWYTLTTVFAQVAESGQVAASSRVSASSQLEASCSCRVLLLKTLLWHHRLGHPSLPHLRSMHSRLLVSGLPKSLPSLLPCLPSLEGRQRAAPHSSEFPPTTAPLQTLHMDMWGPTPISGTDQERYFLLLRKRFRRDFPVLRLHSDRGGEFSSDLLAEFYRDEGIRQSFTLPASPQQNGIAERRIGLIMEPHVSEPETSPTLRWTGKVGDASVFWVWGALSLVRDAKASKLSSRTLRCGPAPSGVSQVNPPSLVEPLEISSDSSGPAEGGDPAADDTAATRRSPRLETPPGFPPRPSSPPPQPAAVDSGAETTSAEPGGAETDGAGSGGVATGGAGSGGAATGGAGSRGAATGGADSRGDASPSGGGAVGDPAGGPRARQPPQPDLLEMLSPQAIRAWIVRRAAGAGGAAGARGARGATGAAGTGCAGGTACARGGGAAGARGAAGAGGATGAAGAAGAGGVGAAGTAPRRLFFYPQQQSSLPPPDSVLRQVLSLPSSTGLTSRLLCPPTDQSQPQLLPGSPLPAPAPHIERVVLLEPPASSLLHVQDPKSNLARAVGPTVTRLLDTVVTDPDFESTAAFALVTKLVDFAARSRLD